MKITLEEVRRIAALAHLDFPEDDLRRLAGELDRILEYIDQLAQLDVDGIEPALSLTAEHPPPREDRAGECLTNEEALANAPESGRGHFKVPRVIG